MSKMTFTSEIEEWEEFDTKIFHPAKTVTMEIDTDNVTWGALLVEFFNFCNASGYIIDGVIIPEMVEACEEIHRDKWYDKKCMQKENTDVD